MAVTSDERAELRGTILEGREAIYEVGAAIGVGGTGVVFEAHCEGGSSRPLVVKTLRPLYAYHADLCRRLRREAEVSRRVRHPGLVSVVDEGLLPDGSPFIIMERIRGEGLHRFMRRYGPLSGDEIVALSLRTLDILHSVHAAGYVHRDVKPEHLLLDRDLRGDLRLRLLDFGVCASETAPADERERERGRVFGTPSYCSPEQAAGIPEVDGRADLFGLGVVMFEALSGRLPFSASTVSNLLRKILRERAPKLEKKMPEGARLDPALEGIVMNLLGRRPEERFGSAREAARAMAPFAVHRREVERAMAANLLVGQEQQDNVETMNAA